MQVHFSAISKTGYFHSLVECKSVKTKGEESGDVKYI